MYNDLAFRLEMFDPLDRPIEDDSGLDQAMKIDELLEAVRELPALNGSDLRVPMSDKVHALFERQLDAENKAIAQAAEKFIKQAQQEGENADSSNLGSH
jgi:hypothetical protein